MRVNDELARTVRDRLAAVGVLCMNMISAPGSGKTALLEASLEKLKKGLRVAVIEGDPDTTLDAERIAQHDVPVVQIQTAGGCHLEANLVLNALENFDLDALDLLFIENVGNLVCPVEFDLGENLCVALVSVTEGHDKPAKYPKLFRKADVVVLNKMDLMPYVDFDNVKFREYVDRLNPGVPIIETSCKTGEGIDAWVDFVHKAATPAETA
jgi:hydrogenase nickel incorporation protein HypB